MGHKHTCDLCVSHQFVKKSLLVLPLGLKLPLLLLQRLQPPLLGALLLQQQQLLQLLLLPRLQSAGDRTDVVKSHLTSLMNHHHPWWRRIILDLTLGLLRQAKREAHTANLIYKTNVWVKTLGTYEFRLISLNDISVLPLVLLHS